MGSLNEFDDFQREGKERQRNDEKKKGDDDDVELLKQDENFQLENLGDDRKDKKEQNSPTDDSMSAVSSGDDDVGRNHRPQKYCEEKTDSVPLIKRHRKKRSSSKKQEEKDDGKKKKNSQKRSKSSLLSTETKIRSSNPKYQRCCKPFCWIFFISKTIIALFIICILSYKYVDKTQWFEWTIDHLKIFKFQNEKSSPASSFLYSTCDSIQSKVVWSMGHSAIMILGNMYRLTNTNTIIFGFEAGSSLETGHETEKRWCDNSKLKMENQKVPCAGGIRAIDANSGRNVWTLWRPQPVIGFKCGPKLHNFDETKANSKMNGGGLNVEGSDCIARGKDGSLYALDALTGQILWELFGLVEESEFVPHHLSATFINDVDGDGITDVLMATNAKQDRDFVAQVIAVDRFNKQEVVVQKDKPYGRITVFSGANGTVLASIKTPDRRTTYMPPITHTLYDGEQHVIFGTGNFDVGKGGSLYFIPLHRLISHDLSAIVEIYRNEDDDEIDIKSDEGIIDHSGVVKKQGGFVKELTRVDLDKDWIDDILVVNLDGSVIAFNGRDFKPMWNVSTAQLSPGSGDYSSSSAQVNNIKVESFTIPSVGSFHHDHSSNVDDTPDIFVQHQFGEEGYPIYYYETGTIISGKNGTILKEVTRNSLSYALSNSVVLPMQGVGNDVILHWSADCLNSAATDHARVGKPLIFSFPDYISLEDQIFADVCGQLFDDDGSIHKVTKLNAIQRKTSNDMSSFASYAIYDSTLYERSEIKTFLAENRRKEKGKESVVYSQQYRNVPHVIRKHQGGGGVNGEAGRDLNLQQSSGNKDERYHIKVSKRQVVGSSMFQRQPDFVEARPVQIISSSILVIPNDGKISGSAASIDIVIAIQWSVSSSFTSPWLMNELENIPVLNAKQMECVKQQVKAIIAKNYNGGENVEVTLEMEQAAVKLCLGLENPLNTVFVSPESDGESLYEMGRMAKPSTGTKERKRRLKTIIYRLKISCICNKKTTLVNKTNLAHTQCPQFKNTL